MTTHDLGTGGIFCDGRLFRRAAVALSLLLVFVVGCRSSRDAVVDEQRRDSDESAPAAPLPQSLLRDDWAAEVDLPPSDSRLYSPIPGEVSIIQGNDGAYSHSDDFNRYAWDYSTVVGTPIVAPRAGIVSSRVMHSNIGAPSRTAIVDGNHLRLLHDDGTETLYLHLSYDETVPEIGEFCVRGEVIGRTGMTGWTDRPHLHFAVMKGGRSRPARFFDFEDNGGVPRAGDRHRSGLTADFDQETIAYYKRAYRAARRARELGMFDAGLILAESTLAAPRDPNYFYHKVLEVYRRRFREALASVGGTPEDNERRRLVLEGRTDTAKMSDRDRKKTLWAEGRAAWCTREYVGAVDRLAEAARGVTMGERAAIIRDVEKLGTEALRDFEHRMIRLYDESGRARPEYRATVIAEAQRRCEFATSLMRFIKVEFPELSAWAEAAEATRTKHARKLGLSLGARRMNDVPPGIFPKRAAVRPDVRLELAPLGG